ncbi:unnamed protein product [Pedinophyceae sp. YPF-701]|nr:unnamed protein product [Pedinophyceae sp. YPF-701]
MAQTRMAAVGSSAAAPRLRSTRRPVVTAAVIDSKGRVLVLRRSAAVSTYPGLLHFVSGGLDKRAPEPAPGDSVVCGYEDPQEAAFREVYEETGISRDDHGLVLVRAGRPLQVDDDGRRLIVYPFLLQVPCRGDSIDVALNWENTEAFWTSAANLPPPSSCVPKLHPTLGALAVSSTALGWLQDLHDDRDHGAVELAVWAAACLGQEAQRLLASRASDAASLAMVRAAAHAAIGQVLKAAPGRPLAKRSLRDVAPRTPDLPGCPVRTDGLEHFRDLAFHLAMCRPSMAPIAAAAVRVLRHANAILSSNILPPSAFDAIPRTADSPSGPVLVAVEEAAALVIAEIEAASDAAASQAAAVLASLPRKRGLSRVLTHSYSSLVVRTVRNLRQEVARVDGAGGETGQAQIGVAVCEARPRFEGAAAARAVADAVDRIAVVTDAQAAVAVREADAVLLGADTVGTQGVANKVGSLPIALCARRFNVPVVFVATDLKLEQADVRGAFAIRDTVLGPAGEAVRAQSRAPLQHEDMGGAEVCRGWPGELQAWGSARGDGVLEVRNQYFEDVPWDLADTIVTESGAVRPDEAAAAASVDAADALDDVFGSGVMGECMLRPVED